MANVIYNGQQMTVPDERLEEARQYGAKLPGEIMMASHQPGKDLGVQSTVEKPSMLEALINGAAGIMGPYAAAGGGALSGSMAAPLTPNYKQDTEVAKQRFAQSAKDYPVTTFAGGLLSPEAVAGGAAGEAVGGAIGGKLIQSGHKALQRSLGPMNSKIPEDVYQMIAADKLGAGQAVKDVGTGALGLGKAGLWAELGKMVPGGGLYGGYKAVKAAKDAAPYFVSPAVRATTGRILPWAGAATGNLTGSALGGQ